MAAQTSDESDWLPQCCGCTRTPSLLFCNGSLLTGQQLADIECESKAGRHFEGLKKFWKLIQILNVPREFSRGTCCYLHKVWPGPGTVLWKVTLTDKMVVETGEVGNLEQQNTLSSQQQSDSDGATVNRGEKTDFCIIPKFSVYHG